MHLFKIFAYQFFFYLRMPSSAIDNLVQTGNACIFHNASDRDDTITSSVFGKHYDFLCDTVAYLLNSNFFAVNFDLSFIIRIQSEDCSHCFGTSCTHQSGKSYDLTFVSFKVNIFKYTFASKSFYFKDRLTNFNFFFRINIVHLTSNHQCNDFVKIDL